MEFKSLLVSYMLFMLISILISSNVLLVSGSMTNSGGAGGFGGSGGISGQSGGISGPQTGPQFPSSQGAMTIHEGDLQHLLQSFLQCTQSPQQLMQPQCMQIIQQLFPILSALGQSPDQMQYLGPETQQLLQQAFMQGAQLLQQVGPPMQMQQPPFQQQPFPPTQQLPPQGMLPQQPQSPSAGLFSFRSGPTTAQPFTMLILEPRGNATGEKDIASSLLSLRDESTLTFNKTLDKNMTMANETEAMTTSVEPKTLSFLRNTAELLIPSNGTSFQNITQPNITPLTNDTNTLDSNLTKSKRGR